MVNENSKQVENSSEKLGWLATLLICGVILASGVGLVVFIYSTQPGTRRVARRPAGAVVVETITVDTGIYRPEIEAMGTVKPEIDVQLSPQVSGEIIKRYGNFNAGSYVEKGDTLVKIDPRDYENTLAQRRSAYQQVISRLEIEMGQQMVAREEFKLLGEKIPEDKRELVLRKPQLKSARADLQAARATLEQAKLNLQRTTIKAPFDAHILSRDVSLGSRVSAGNTLGRLVGMDKFWVDVTVPVSKLRWLNVPDTPGAAGSEVKIFNKSAWGPGEYRTGYIYSLIGELDQQTRMARVRIGVEDPLARETNNSNSRPLIVGSYVRALLSGIKLPAVVRLNRDYLREGSTVWLMGEGKLVIRPVSILCSDRKYVYVKEGLKSGDRIVTSSLATAVEGMPLKIKDSGSSPEKSNVSTDTGSMKERNS